MLIIGIAIGIVVGSLSMNVQFEFYKGTMKGIVNQAVQQIYTAHQGGKKK